MLWCCVTPERQEKTERIMRALTKGSDDAAMCVGPPPAGADPFVVWGHLWLGERIIPPAIAEGRPWWLVDNGYWKPARGQAVGYYSLTYRSLSPVLLDDPDMNRLRVPLEPWRTRRDGCVLLAMPGKLYGRMLGMDMAAWAVKARVAIRKHTDRRILVRDKTTRRPLVHDLAAAAVVVTHSSKVAVDAVRAGIPAIVASTNPASPVCSTNLADIENPPMPDRRHWWQSLMCQQFTLAEMRNGTAQAWMEIIAEQVDADRSIPEELRLAAKPDDHDSIQSGIPASGDDALRAEGDRARLC